MNFEVSSLLTTGELSRSPNHICRRQQCTWSVGQLEEIFALGIFLAPCGKASFISCFGKAFYFEISWKPLNEPVDHLQNKHQLKYPWYRKKMKNDTRNVHKTTGSEAESRLRGEQLGEKMWGRQRRARELLGDRFFVNTTNFPPPCCCCPSCRGHQLAESKKT